MKKWKTLANPVDPSIWADVSNMWPTGRGSYEVADCYPSSGTSITATGENADAVSAWAFKTLSGARYYYFGEYLWELNSSWTTATDRTGALGASAVTSGGHACQYGDVTIVTRGTGASLIYSTGGNFAALAGSPTAKYVCVASNCVLAFNTSAASDQWHASDVGDYTNWTTGEAASGRILENNGAISGCCVFGNDVYVFKTDSIFRMTYVGGTVKWQIQKVWQGVGMVETTVGGGSWCCATGAGIFFAGGASYSAGIQPYYIFDGVSPPRLVNRETDVGNGGYPCYDPRTNMVMVCAQEGVSAKKAYIYYYQIDDDAWGQAASISGGNPFSPVYMIRGDDSALASATGGSRPARPLFNGFASGTDQFFKRTALSPGSIVGGGASSAYVQTHKIPGNSDLFAEGQATFGPAVPVIRRRTEYSSGSPALALTVDTYAEAHDTTAAATASVTESTIRDRFDFSKSDSFVQLKLTATDTDIEIEDISCRVIPAGRK